MSKLTFKEWSILSDLQIIDSIQEDYEYSMARSELKTAQNAISRLMKKLQGEGELEAWIQSKITKASDYIDTVADYIDSGESETKDDVKEAVLGRYEDRKKTLRSKEERLGKKKETPDAPTGPKITKLKPRGPRKGEATASQVQGWRGSDRTNTNRRGQTAPQAKALAKEEFVDESLKPHHSVEEIAKKHRLEPSFIQNQLEMGIKIEHEHVTDKTTATDIALQHLDEIPDYYTRLKKMESSAKKEHKKFKDVKESWSEKYKKSIDCDNPKGFSQRAHCQGLKKKVKEDTEILDAQGNVFATVVDLIKGTDDRFKGFTQPITEDAVKELENGLKKLDDTSYDSIDNLMRRIMEKHNMSAKELHNAFVDRHNKTPDEWIKESVILEKCWPGYKKKGMKTMFGKRYPNCVKEEGLRDWFGKSKSKDGKSGWVNVVTGGTCASDEPGEGTPKCVSSSKRESMTDEERKSAARRKKLADPEQQSKSGAAKPTYVATDVKEESDKKTKGSGTKDACYTKVKSRYSVWPSAYASGALVRCRKVGSANWGNKSESVDLISNDPLSEQMGLIRYCSKCEKNETSKECKYGEKYWSMFSIPSNLAPKKPFSIAKVHPANEALSFEVRKSSGAGALTPAAAAQLGPKAIDLQKKKAAGVDLPLKSSPGSMAKLADAVIYPGELTTEDYQRLQSTGAVYTILFSWRGRPMMNLQLFFPTQKRPSKDEVKSQVDKLYPGAVVMQWYPSPTDPTKPIVVIQK
jgi:hypothetical protein